MDNYGISEEELKVFLEDTDEQIQLLNEAIVELEKDPEDSSLLQKIFRAAHTIKGGAATLGQAKMTEITHHMENIFDNVRKGLIPITPELIDVVFDCVDVLKQFKDDMAEGVESDMDTDELVNNLEEFVASLEKNQATESVGKVAEVVNIKAKITDYFDFGAELKAAAANNIDNGRKVYFVFTAFEATCEMKAVRAFQFVNEIVGVADIIKANPAVDDIYNEKVGDYMSAIVSTDKEMETIKKILQSIDELAGIKVEEIIKDAEGSVTYASALEKVTKGKKNVDGNVSKVGRTVRVDVERLDSLLNLVGELVIDRTRIYQLGLQMSQKFEEDELSVDMMETSTRIARVTAELQEEIMKARMLPIGNVFSKFPRMVRDTAKKCGKKINFEIGGQATELDRSVIEEIGDPLIHILRNAVDHGVEMPDDRRAYGKNEEGNVTLKAFHEENHIVIQVVDDGKGIDPEILKNKAIDKGLFSADRIGRMTKKEIINLIFVPGMSTATEVTDVSGRGVGMDIVRNNIEKINGQILIDSKVGKGSVFTIKLPLTLAIIQALMINVNERIFAIPLTSVQETIQIHNEDIQHLKNQEAIMLRGNVLPILRMKNIFYPELDSKDTGKLFIVVVSMLDKQVGLVVDSLVGEQEIVIKNLSKFIGDIKGISGATIMGDGRVALILDIASLINKVINENML